MKGTTELLVEAHRILNETPNISLTAMFIEGARYIELSSKPHVAEVVICGDINKPKTFDGVTDKQLSEIAKEAMNKYHKTMEKLCDHLSVDLPSNAGYMCPKCGEWINGENV